MKPNDELREVETSLRSTLYITSTGSMYRNYNDTGAWEYVQPRCDNNGKMCGYKNKSIQRLIAEAWLEPPVATTEGNRLPNIRTIDVYNNPYDVNNIEWCYGKKCTNTQIVKRLPPKLDLLNEILLEKEFESIEEISQELNVSVPTTWNYLCKLVSINPSIEILQNIVTFVNQSCLEVCIQNELKGTLKEAMSYVNEKLRNEKEWIDEHEKYSHLRLSRMYCNVLHNI
jgi:hypothetical protein